MRFIHCPECGERLISRDLGDDKDVPWCVRCGKPWFDMFPSCVIVLVYNDNNEVLLLNQGYISTQYRNLVSGYMKPGESAEETARREVLEETGIKVDSLDFAGTYWFAKKQMLMIGFMAHCSDSSHSLRLSLEVDGADWVQSDEAPNLVHPKGSVSHILCDLFLDKPQIKKQQLNQP